MHVKPWPITSCNSNSEAGIANLTNCCSDNGSENKNIKIIVV